MNRVLHNPLNGRFTTMDFRRSYEDAKPQKASNYWSSSENNKTNAWNVNFNNGNCNGNNKYNSNVARGVAALDGFDDFYNTVADAYHDCMKGKMRSTQALEYMSKAHEDLPILAMEMWKGAYQPSTSTCFLVKYPKLREVFAANFRDRIVHHWICLRLEPLFEKRFNAQGNVSFNCRKGYGTDACIRHFAKGMERVSVGYTRPAWVFRGDLVGFFTSIDQRKLWYLLERFIRRERMKDGNSRWMYWDILVRVVYATVMHRPEKDCILNSDATEWSELPANKSFFTSEDGKGEPIGNLTTQQFANFLLSYLDVYVEFVFRRKNYAYARFVDDFAITCDDSDFLKDSISRIDTFLRDSLLLKLHKDKRYLQPVSHGLKFVGSYIKPKRVYLSNRTLARFEERANGFARLMLGKDELDKLDCSRIEQVINSYLGFCKGRCTYRRRREIIALMGERFYRYFYIRGHYDSIRTKQRYRLVYLLNE